MNERNSNDEANNGNDQRTRRQLINGPRQQQQRIVKNPSNRIQPSNNAKVKRAKNPAEAHLARFQAKVRSGNLANVRQQRPPAQVNLNANGKQNSNHRKSKLKENHNSQPCLVQQVQHLPPNNIKLLQMHAKTHAKLE